LIESCLDAIQDRVNYIVIGTHSRDIEGRLFQAFLKRGWVLEMERPALLDITQGKIVIRGDGVQGWFNPNGHYSPPTVLWGAGFHKQESCGLDEWRWCGSEGHLEIKNPSPGSRPARIDFECRTGHEEFSPVSVKSPLFSGELEVNRHGTRFSKDISLPPGKHRMMFSTTAERSDAPNDHRNLVLQVKNLKIHAQN
jgi:hypothetical protein